MSTPNLQDVLVILDRESVDSSNAPDMRRVMSETAVELRAVTQRRVKRGRIVKYEGVGEVAHGAVTSEEIRARVGARLTAAVSTLRAWGVEV